MSNQSENKAQPSIEELLTLVLMGEANVAQASQVEAALLQDPDLRVRRDSLLQTMSLLQEVGSGADESALNSQRREALRSAALQQLKSRRWRATRWLSAAVFLLMVGGVSYWTQESWFVPYAPEARHEAAALNLERAQGGLRKQLRSKKGAPVASAVSPDLSLQQLGCVSESADSALHVEALVPTTYPQTMPASAAAPSESKRHGGESLVLSARSENIYELEREIPPEFDANPSTGAFFDDYGSGDFRAHTEDLLGGYAGRLEYDERRRPQPRCVVFDGYGRRFVDRSVLLYLHPQSKQESPRDMFFRYYGDNPEVVTKLESVSTFAADVDTASYPLARNYLVNGQLPPKQAIRTEEFVNYFDYALPTPLESDFTVRLQAMPSLFGHDGERTLLSIGIKAREVLDENRKPLNLVFVIDKSGSMDGGRMQLVKNALELVVDQLRQDDTLGIVTFDSRGHVMLEPTSAKQRWKMREVIRNLGTGGSTNAAEGLEMGYKMMETYYSPTRINRLVLASDGVANTGETDQARILQQVRAQAEADVDLTTLGVGMGNHNDVFLEQLADQGNGSCHYIDDLQEAKRVLVEQFLGTMVTVARDVKIQVEFKDQVVRRWRQLGYENRALRHEDFRDDSIDAGEVGSGHQVTALYELDLAPSADPEADLVTVRLRWFPEGSSQAVEKEFRMPVSAILTQTSIAPAQLRLAAVVAQYAEVLRRSFHARGDSYINLQNEAQKLVREMPSALEVRELRDLIERTADLARWSVPNDELSQLMEAMRGQQLQAAQLRLLGGDDEGTALLLATIELQNQQIEQRFLELLEE